MNSIDFGLVRIPIEEAYAVIIITAAVQNLSWDTVKTGCTCIRPKTMEMT
jgi:hypothetical protein